MALIPTMSISNSGDLSTIYMVDTTGLYDASLNPGGYGTPNTALSAIAYTEVLSIVYYPPDGGPSVTYPSATTYPTTANPSPYILNESYALTPAMFGLTQTTWADGIYVITYQVADSMTHIYQATAQYLFTGNAECCLDNKLVNVCFCGDCNCDDTDLLFFNWMGLRASEAGIACLKNGEALDTLQCVSNWCAEDDCGC